MSGITMERIGPFFPFSFRKFLFRPVRLYELLTNEYANVVPKFPRYLTLGRNVVPKHLISYFTSKRYGRFENEISFYILGSIDVPM